MDTRASHPRSKRPTVGLDEPCRECGEPIYYNYKGPVEGICGKCTDRVRKASRRRHHIRPMVVDGRVSRFWLGLVIILAFAAGAVAGYLLHTFVPL